MDTTNGGQPSLRISRRHFCAAAGATGLLAMARTSQADDAPSLQLRVIAYNIQHATGWPQERPATKKAYEKRQMARRLALELALHEPDVINFSESPVEAVTKEIAEYLGMHHVRFQGGQYPGTVLSRYEIIDSADTPLGQKRPEDMFTRHWGRATIKLPGGEPLIVHSAHLFHLPDSPVRLREVKAMLATMKDDLANGRSMLLMGDLNHTPDMPEYKLWIDAGWIDTFAKVGKDKGLTVLSNAPSRRIDYIMAAGPIADQIAESRPLFEGAFRLNTADERAFALSDHLPLLTVFGKGG